jgi:hypothetical protein
MNCHIYLRNGIVYVPTMGRMDRGFYRGVEPVAVVPVSNTEGLRRALAETIARGNPDVPMLRRNEWPPPVLLKYAGVKTWSTFERDMSLWDIKQDAGSFRIESNSKRANGMWLEDPKKTITFAPGTSVDDVVERMITIVEEAARTTAPRITPSA